MLTDYMAVGENEIWNTVRLRAYLQNVGSPFDNGAQICGCDTLTAAMLDQPNDAETPPYTTPATDPAPWYDVDTPASADYLGFLPLSVTGLEDNPRARNVTNTVGGGGIFGPQRELPRTITVTGLVIGASCCGSEYGVHYLSEALAGCTGDACDGDCVTMYNCCPDVSMTKAAFDAAHKRTFRRVSLVSGPTIIDRVGSQSCARGTCGANGDIIQVEFVLVAATPWPWTELTELLNVNLPIGGSGACIEWCLSPSRSLISSTRTCKKGECAHAACTAEVDACADPLKSTPAPPSPSAPSAPFCLPLANERACYTLNLNTRPQWGSDVPVITLFAGTKELRNVRVTLYERQAGTTQTCDQIADANRCTPKLNDFFVTYVPKGGTVTIDGQTGRAVITCEGDCQTASTVFGGVDGGPVKVYPMTCSGYCLCIETDPNFPPAANATLTMSVSGRVY